MIFCGLKWTEKRINKIFFKNSGKIKTDFFAQNVFFFSKKQKQENRKRRKNRERKRKTSFSSFIHHSIVCLIWMAVASHRLLAVEIRANDVHLLVVLVWRLLFLTKMHKWMWPRRQAHHPASPLRWRLVVWWSLHTVEHIFQARWCWKAWRVAVVLQTVMSKEQVKKQEEGERTCCSKKRRRQQTQKQFSKKKTWFLKKRGERVCKRRKKAEKG